jgi:hypothetical protein
MPNTQEEATPSPHDANARRRDSRFRSATDRYPRSSAQDNTGSAVFTVGISRAPYLLLTCTGNPAFKDFLALADLAAALCRRERWTRVLMDCVSVPPVLTADERVRICAYAGEMLPGKHVAVVVPDEKRFEATGSAAASTGGMLRFFASHLEAASWLEAAAR